MTSKKTEPTWMMGASLVENTFGALEIASGDAPFILDRDDLEKAAAWVITDVPISAIKYQHCDESQSDRQKRLQAIREIPGDKIYPLLRVKPGHFRAGMDSADGQSPSHTL